MWEKESRMYFTMTRIPHGHLLSLLDSWSDDQDYYSILSLVQINLRSLLLSPLPRLDAALERWLPIQFHGLVDGLPHIHEILSHKIFLARPPSG